MKYLCVKGEPYEFSLESSVLRLAPRKEHKMLQTIAIILIVLWLLGMVTSYTIGGFIHILLVVAVVMFLIRIIQGQRPI